jgi:hypothetical protein
LQYSKLIAIDGVDAWGAYLEALHVDRQSRARWKHALLPTPAHNGVAKKTAVGATIQKASSN